MTTVAPLDKPSVVFFGTGPVAAASLTLLLESFTIEAVVTKPNPEHHKADAPVISVAHLHNLPLLFAADRHELDQLIARQQFASRLAILIDYGIIVSRAIIDSFPLGIVNSHFSLLPEWRGADPITFAVLSGQAQSGVSLMLLVEKMDQGPLLAQATYPLDDTITTPVLTDALIQLSAALLARTIPGYLDGSITPQPQPTTGTSYSRKLTKADGLLLPAEKSASVLAREVRAFLGWPGSKIRAFDRDILVTEATAQFDASTVQPGTITASNDKRQLIVHTIDGQLVVNRLKPAGKKEMDAAAFLRGVQII